jgi:hypothetical protein
MQALGVSIEEPPADEPTMPTEIADPESRP